MKTVRVVVLSWLAMASTVQADSDPLWTRQGFQQPESVVMDTARGELYVSNINGQPGEKNGQGYIAKLASDGELIEQHWLTGLNAPKGMAIQGDRLFVTDIDRLLVIQLPDGQVLESHAPAGAQFLNDVAADERGAVYVSDMMGNGIYRYQQGRVEPWLQDETLMHPNGVLVDGERLLVASWGSPIHADFSTDVPGGLLAIGLDDKVIRPVPGAEALGNLDAVIRVGDSLLTNDWINGRYFRLDEAGGEIESGQFQPGVADLGVAGRVLYLPFMREGEVRAQALP